MLDLSLNVKGIDQAVRKLKRIQRDINKKFVRELRRDAIREVLRPVARDAIRRIRRDAPVDSGHYRRNWKMRILRVREVPGGAGVVIRPLAGRPPERRRGVATGFGLAAILEKQGDHSYRPEVKVFHRTARREAWRFFNRRMAKLSRTWGRI